MSLQGKETKKLFEKARQYLPHGVSSNFRYWSDDDNLVIAKGEGTYIWDADGKRYIDYRLGFGPIILGHAYPQVVDKVNEAIKEGTTFAWTTPLEITVAEKITKMCNIDMVRMTNTGTEATMHALRIARAYTNREKFIKFDGQYHGQADYFMYNTASSKKRSLGSDRSPIIVPVTSGIPKGINEYVYSIPYNNVERLEETIEAHWGDIAAVFLEPIMGNVNGILAEKEFLAKLRELCTKYGIILVFDEVKTGFRIAKGGAQEYYGVQADVVTYAKSMGNGFPVAAIGGKKDIMMNIGPGKTAHGGTFSANSVGMAAADATLDLLESEPVLETINKRGQALMDGIDEILGRSGIPYSVHGAPSMFGFSLGSSEAPRNWREYTERDTDLYEEISMELSRTGVQPDADGMEPWFLCYSLSEEDVAETLTKFEDAVAKVKGQH
ncbi:MAG TPA: guanitoxin biosynthesis PLP-dependent transaminase GntE [Anaerolineales bacterium]|nr:guanitoxin biosynthesis PLP-dependent transaminase GntE [Anaerolineales bacterium]